MGAISGGINLGAPILPATEEDIFPTHDATYGKGGYRAVATVAERDLIPFERRTVGMVVRVTATNTNWILKENTENIEQAVWVEETMDGGTF